MSTGTYAIIKGSDIKTVKKFIVSAYGGEESFFGSGGKEDATITLPKAYGEDRFLRIQENIYGKEAVVTGLYSNIGDLYLSMGDRSVGPTIMKFIALYFGGYYSPTDSNGGPDYRKLKRNNRECIKSYFESIEGNNEV